MVDVNGVNIPVLYATRISSWAIYFLSCLQTTSINEWHGNP